MLQRNVQEHKQEDIRTNGDCCFNHIIGLPQNDGVDKPLYNYEKIIFDSLVTLNGWSFSFWTKCILLFLKSNDFDNAVILHYSPG